MLSDTIDNLCRHRVFLEELNSQLYMTAFLIRDHFPYIMQKAPKPDDVDVCSYFPGKRDTYLGLLQGVCDHILTLGKTVLKSPEESHYWRRQIVYPDTVSKLLTFFKDNAIDLFFDDFYDFFYPSGLHPAIPHETLKCHTRNFPPHGIK